jgi:hypothetical protein
MTGLQPGDFGIDFSGFRLDGKNGRPTLAQARHDGAKFIIRYSAGAGNTIQQTQWKLCGLHEITDAVAAGLDFIANTEWHESRVTMGASAGRADSLADLAFWKERGYAKGAVIIASWDAFPDPTKWAAADAYMRAYSAALQGYYLLGTYGGTPYLRHALNAGLISFAWRTNAPSWNHPTGLREGDGLPYQPSRQTILQLIQAGTAQTKTPAHIWQTGNYWYDKQADENVIVRSGLMSHLAALNRTPPQPQPGVTGGGQPTKPPEEDMAQIDSVSPEAAKAIGDAMALSLITRELAGATNKEGADGKRIPGTGYNGNLAEALVAQNALLSETNTKLGQLIDLLKPKS